MRLQKYMAECGVASRRKCEEIIAQGRVMLNGVVVVQQGEQVDPEWDTVTVDGVSIKHNAAPVYIMLHKPCGVVTTASDQFGRRTVLDLVDVPQRIYPVGRLDYDTEGLLLLTNDGAFAYQMTHPGHEIEKTYLATVEGVPGKEILEKLRCGILLEGRLTAPAKAKPTGTVGGKSRVLLTIHEGRNRQVRKMFQAVGFPVISLKRISIGKLSLGTLPVGEWRYLTPEELAFLTER